MHMPSMTSTNNSTRQSPLPNLNCWAPLHLHRHTAECAVYLFFFFFCFSTTSGSGSTILTLGGKGMCKHKQQDNIQ